MNKHVRSIGEYYTNLEYEDGDNKIGESLERIRFLSSELSFTETDNFAHRFLDTASLMEKNLNFFKSICKHVDVAVTVLNYLYHFGAAFTLETETDNNFIGHILLTIYYMYQEDGIQTFLESVISGVNINWYYEYKNLLLLQIEMIILEDSDLYAVINCLKFIKRPVSCLKNIWVQKSIIQTFMWHFKKNFCHLNVFIQIFGTKQDLLTFNAPENILDANNTANGVSIWSEDIAAAKNLARSLNQNISFINAHMNICPDIVIPFQDIFRESITNPPPNLNVMEKNSPIDPTAHKGLTYDLFYDGIWQKPKNNTYWIHKNILFANATRQDIMECIKSATRGFKNLSTMSSDSRRQMLSKFAAILECHGEFESSKVVSKWINMSYISGNMSYNNGTEEFEIIRTYKPKNVVILKEKDDITTVFKEITQNLIIGNSVIVICNPDLCILAPYCNMFKMCGIPSGVINLLSAENTEYINSNFLSSTSSQAVLAFTVTQYILIFRK